ncbi:prenyltransferase/squalene oxidase repeat-containing protein [Streptomyces sp. NPDC005955]|uniref:prenyltransferase/squalene oxidase repeat-containing protein n=1 Tax=Streptomyces sp. NPDC005955 TaxID=3364738 RepID=UPI0036CA678B
MNIRRIAAVLAATAVLGTVTAPVALADRAAGTPSPSPSAKLPTGLYGTTDPTYDGVWRQSLAMLAQDTAEVAPAAAAVDWLTGQQCANGAFAAYRAAPDAPCDAKTPVDTNSTAAAVQALAALGGQDDATGDAVDWLKSVQNADGGWGYLPGAPSDTNSTGLVVGALTATGARPAQVRSAEGTTPHDALLALTVPCTAGGGGAFAYQPDKKGALVANDDATAAGVLGGLDRTLAPTAAPDAAPRDCAKPRTAAEAARGGAAHLAGVLKADGHLKSSLPGADDQPDHGNTADAVVALAAAGLGDRAAPAVTWLERNSVAWAKQTGPAAWAQLVLAAHATGADPRDFGGTDLVAGLNATGPEPSAARDGAAGKDGDDGPAAVWIIGPALLLGAGIGFLVSRRKRQQ